MATNPNLVRVFGSSLDAINLAPLATAMPTAINTALNVAFEDVGWLGDDGITETLTGSLTKLRGHQGNGVVRQSMTEPGTQFSFVALETKEQTKQLRYNVKTSSVATQIRTQTRGPGQIVAARACVIDLFDKDNTTIQERYIIPRLEITPNGDRQAMFGGFAVFPFLGEIIGDYTVISNEVP